MAKKAPQRNAYKRKGTLQRSPLYTMHARAAKKRSENMHRAGALVVSVAAVAAAVWIVVAGTGGISRWLFAENSQFTIRQLDVSSSGRLSPEHIKEFSGVGLGANLFAVDIEEVRRKLEDGPLVKNAEIQRKLPDTLMIRITERVPLARIAHGTSRFFFSIDRDGHVLGLAGPSLRAMPVIKGLSDKGVTPGTVLRDGGALDALKVIEMCGSGPVSQVIEIDTIDVTHADYLDLSLKNNVKVLLPRNTSRSKIEDLVLYLRESGGRISFIDLTVDRNVPAT